MYDQIDKSLHLIEFAKSNQVIVYPLHFASQSKLSSLRLPIHTAHANNGKQTNKQTNVVRGRAHQIRWTSVQALSGIERRLAFQAYARAIHVHPSPIRSWGVPNPNAVRRKFLRIAFGLLAHHLTTYSKALIKV